jgi:hypothetical protein
MNLCLRIGHLYRSVHQLRSLEQILKDGQYKYREGGWNVLPLVSNATDWSLIPAKNARGEGLLVTPCPDSEPLSAAIRTITNGAVLK